MSWERKWAVCQHPDHASKNGRAGTGTAAITNANTAVTLSIPAVPGAGLRSACGRQRKVSGSL